MSSFVHLHLHTHYSLLDGLGKPADYIKKAKEEHNAPAVAITDHGVMYGAIEFYKKCKEYGIKPIIGCEVYITDKSRFEKDKDNKYFHLILLAKNLEGYHNLMRLTTKASMEGFYYKPRIDHELLAKYSGGLIGTSACLGSELCSSIMKNMDDLTTPIEIAKKYQSMFEPGHYFLEVQSHLKIDMQAQVNEKIYEIADELKLPVVATNDCHYANKEDADAHDILICIQTGKTIYDENRMRYGDDFSMKSPEQMREEFKGRPDVCDNTLKIAEMIDLEIPLGNNLLPPYKTPQKKDQKEYLRELCEKGLEERYGKNPDPEIKERLEYELGLINKMGFASYFLIVQDFINYAKEQDILVGPGRGSAAGSIIAYCLKITDIDPLKYNLLFERFLNPERISMPDIDVDFADKRRDEVLEYVQEKYGKDRVAQIITFGTMAARAAVRDVGRALGLPYSEVDVIAKAIPGRPGTKLQEALDEEYELKNLYDTDPSAKKVLDNALKLEGCIRHSSVHACAVVISSEELTCHCPLQKASGQEDTTITQYSMKPIEEIGLLKMDFLGLKNLTILETTMNIIKNTKGEDIDLDSMSMDDKKAFELLQDGSTTGVFQLESGGMKRYLKELKPTCFEDIIAMVSLYRPGPMEWIPEYIACKHGKKEVQYVHEDLAEILKETYGIAIYQEQILQIAQKFSGFSLGEADILRRAIGKKIASELASQREKFIKGAIEKGYEKKLAIKIFDEVIEPFAGYGFNKSHAACYALIAYQTAFLKSRYPAEFMAALLTADSDNTDRVIIEIAECKQMGITILPPSVNQSLANFTVVDDSTIRFGLSAIKGVGMNTVQEIIRIRKKGGEFKNLEDFAKRVPSKLINKKTLESLALSGALDEIGERKEIVENVQQISTFAKEIQNTQKEDQIDLFGMMEAQGVEVKATFNLNKVPPATQFQKLKWEREYLGMFVSAHPLQGLNEYIKRKGRLIGGLNTKDIEKDVKVSGLVTTAKTIFTKKGDKMCYCTLEDTSSSIEVIVFPKTFSQVGHKIAVDKMLSIEGKLVLRNQSPQLVCRGITEFSLEQMIKNAKQAGVFDEDEHIALKKLTIEKNKEGTTILLEESVLPDELKQLKTLLLENKGDESVEIHVKDKQKIKRIKVPFGVAITKDLKSKIEELLKEKVTL